MQIWPLSRKPMDALSIEWTKIQIMVRQSCQITDDILSISNYQDISQMKYESIYISPRLSIQSLFTYICVLSLYL